MISGAPTWRGIALVAFVTLSLAVFGIALELPYTAQAEIRGTVESAVSDRVTVTISADGASQTVQVPPQSERPPDEPPGVEYAIPLESGGEYNVSGESHDVRYAVVPVENGTQDDLPLDQLENVTQTVTVTEGEPTSGVDFVVLPRDGPIEERPPPVRDGDGGGLSLPVPGPLVIAVVVLTMIVALALQFVRAAPAPAVAVDRRDEDTSDAEEVRTIAGQAADRIADAGSVENEVYRAWFEMTRALDVAAPETLTPGEFERAAIDAGFPPAAVAQLTDLFNEVRYGGANPDVHAEEAVETLRAIETATADRGEDDR